MRNINAVMTATFLKRLLSIRYCLLSEYGAMSSDARKRTTEVIASHKLTSKKDKGKFIKNISEWSMH
jgi:hypothetical protein